MGGGGHIIRMAGERIPEKVLNGKFQNQRLVGKPRTRWEDVIWMDTSQILGIQGWQRRAEDREEWRHLLRDARPRRGCSTIDGTKILSLYSWKLTV